MFKDYLRRLRAEKGNTQEQMAKMIGVPRTTYAAWEQGLSEPRINDLVRLKQILVCTYEELLEGE